MVLVHVTPRVVQVSPMSCWTSDCASVSSAPGTPGDEVAAVPCGAVWPLVCQRSHLRHTVLEHVVGDPGSKCEVRGFSLDGQLNTQTMFRQGRARDPRESFDGFLIGARVPRHLRREGGCLVWVFELFEGRQARRYFAPFVLPRGRLTSPPSPFAEESGSSGVSSAELFRYP